MQAAQASYCTSGLMCFLLSTHKIIYIYAKQNVQGIFWTGYVDISILGYDIRHHLQDIQYNNVGLYGKKKQNV